MWSAKVIDKKCWLISPEGEKIVEFVKELEVGRVVALLNISIRPRTTDNERLISFMQEQRAAEKKLPKDLQRKIARERLIREGIYREGPDGEMILHENYGGPPLEP